MQRPNTQIKITFTKTLLIVLGILVAALMSMGTTIFTAESLTSTTPDTPAVKPCPKVSQSNDGDVESSGLNFNSGTRLFHVFTENLPYLNNK